MREIIRADGRLTIREVAEEVRIAFGTCQNILTEDLQMRRVTAKLVPRLLTAEQKDDRVSLCTDLRDGAQNDPNFMSSVTNAGFTVMTGKQSKCPPSGAHHHLLDRRKRGK